MTGLAVVWSLMQRNPLGDAGEIQRREDGGFEMPESKDAWVSGEGQ